MSFVSSLQSVNLDLIESADEKFENSWLPIGDKRIPSKSKKDMIFADGKSFFEFEAELRDRFSSFRIPEINFSGLNYLGLFACDEDIIRICPYNEILGFK